MEDSDLSFLKKENYIMYSLTLYKSKSKAPLKKKLFRNYSHTFIRMCFYHPIFWTFEKKNPDSWFLFEIKYCD